MPDQVDIELLKIRVKTMTSDELLEYIGRENITREELKIVDKALGKRGTYHLKMALRGIFILAVGYVGLFLGGAIYLRIFGHPSPTSRSTELAVFHYILFLAFIIFGGYFSGKSASSLLKKIDAKRGYPNNKLISAIELEKIKKQDQFKEKGYLSAIVIASIMILLSRLLKN